MNTSELKEIIRNGENSGVEFKRDDILPEKEARLYQQSGRLQYDRKPVPGGTFENLDSRRLINYFRDIRKQEYPNVDDIESWQRLLVNTELMTEDRGKVIPSVGGLLLFDKESKRFLPQAGISAAAYPGEEKDYSAKERTYFDGPVVSLFSEKEDVLERGIIEQAMDFVRRNISIDAWIEMDARRHEKWEYPLEAVREAIVNAIAHRDYTITVVDIELSIYSNRMEIISPGRLPNTVTVEKMRAGYRASRNELLKEVLRDYQYIESTGLGVPRKIIKGMLEHNGTAPDLVEEDDRFTVRLWSGK